MSEAILMSGGSGGVGSDDVTAGKAHVLKGYKTVTRDSDDEVVEGEIISRGTWATASEVVNAPWETNVHTRFEEGYYIKDGQYKPTAKIPYAVLANVIGVDPAKMLQSLTLVGKRGQIKSVDTGANNYRFNKSINYGIDNWSDVNNPVFYVDLPHGNAFYNRDDGHPHVCIDADKLGNATADKVLAGSTFTSKNGLAVQGTIPNRGNGMKAVDFYNAHWESNFVARMEQGYYEQIDQWKPYVAIPYAVLANVVGIDPAKMLKSLTIAGRQGQIEERGSYIDAVGIWYYGAGNNLVGQIPPGYYGADNGNGKTNVNIKKQDIVNALGLNPDLWLDTFQTMGIQGKIPRWIATHGDVIIANPSHSGQGFAYDLPGVGRGIVVGIKNGAFIQGANYAFLPSPNLQHWNIRKDVNINGTIGTMEDYGAGGVPFNGATFDGRLASGVANKGFILEHIPRFLNFKNTGYGYAGIQDGGMKLLNGYAGNTHIKSAPDVGCVLSKSINLTPFRYIKIGFRFLTFRGDGTASQPARISLEAGVTPIGNAGGESYNNESHTILRDIGQRSKSVSHVMTSTRTNAGDISDKSQQFMTLDVTDRTGHHFMYFMLGNIVHEYSQGSVYAVAIVNHIEFIN